MILLVTTLILLGHSLIQEDLVQMMPPFNMSDFNYSIYSGYLQITNQKQQFHYVFVESQLGIQNHSIPLLLWLNGGPGCSSLMGMLQEIGPFVFPDDSSMILTQNPFSWNRKAHLLFLESPSGVGFSRNPNKLIFNDDQVASDNLAALQEFFSNYPSFQNNPLWIAGESYAGVYIPMLAVQIDNFNAQQVALINLKGILVGNGVTNRTQLQYSQIEYLQQHNLIPPNMNISICEVTPKSVDCRHIIEQINSITEFIDPYNIYGYCWHQIESSSLSRRMHLGSDIPVGAAGAAGTIAGASARNPNEVMGIPCTASDNIEQYLNNPLVQQYLHVDPIMWYLCQPQGVFHYEQDPTAGLLALDKLISKNGRYDILLYNGDSDSVVPWLDTLKALQTLNLQIQEEWRPYYVKDRQLGGYIQKYVEQIRFMTIRGAGHMVPQNDREIGFHIIECMLDGKDF